MSEPIVYASSPDVGPPNRVALVAMIVGITALLLSLAVIGGILGLVAIVLGIMGVIKPRRKGMAIAGIATGTLALPVAFVAFFFWLGVFLAVSGGGLRTAQMAATRAEMSNLKVAIETFEVDTSRYPSTAEGLDALVVRPAGLEATWHGKYIPGVPTDRWGHPFLYEGPDLAGAGQFEIISAGPDGTFGTADDLFSSMP